MGSQKRITDYLVVTSKAQNKIKETAAEKNVETETIEGAKSNADEAEKVNVYHLLDKEISGKTTE